ncbi:hypothetical protein EXU85_16555 [Spirosoma sp. KCTC 42546]|uniref:hypothetical protein n=1 Tax=Spirosoma sp. KCTC 42546 TaxID=2520506 RepID=UPI001158FFFA|nr:hypothetical protein [Spirosoma sp. KCTC 42546]QDK80128.1 hypothetical protein EXU85_16555 [Spirosoma sp. KCTC 42546]
MNPIRLLLVCTTLLLTLTHCKKDDGNNPTPTEASQTELLVANNWRTVQVSTPDGQAVNKSRLNLATQVLYDLNMQFRNDGTVRALDPKQSNSVINGGTWTLATDNKSIDVDVSGFKGNFPIIQLTKSKLILRQRAPVDGKDADINLEFDPTL